MAAKQGQSKVAPETKRRSSKAGMDAGGTAHETEPQVPEVLQQLVLANLGEAMVVTRGFRVLLANEAYARLVGAECAEALRGADQPLVLTPESRRIAEDRYRRRVAGEVLTDSHIYEGHTLDGRLVRFTLFAIAWPNDPTVLLGVLRDVTEQEADLAALRDTERLYRAVAETVPMAVILRDPELRVVYANDEASKMTGYTREEILADALLNGLPREDREAVTLGWKERREIPPREFGMRFKDRRKHWIFGGTRPVHDESGHYVGMCNAFIDITDRKKTEEALAAKSAALESLFSAFPDIYLRISSDLVFLDCYAGQGAELYAPEETFLGRRVDEILPKQLATLTNFKVKHVLKTGKMESYEYDLEIGGVVRSYQARMSPFGNGVAAVIQDISRRKQAERDLQRALNELERRYSAEQDIMNNITHEVRTPLTAVVGYTTMLLERVAGPLNEQQESMVRKAMQGAMTLMRMMDTAIHDARMKQNPMRLRLKQSRPTRIAQTSTGAILPEATEKGIALEYVGPEDQRAGLYDPDKIRTVLFNLLSNAVKFTQEGKIQVMASDTERGSEIIVVDSGPGIPPEDIPTIFERFKQVERPGKSKAMGFGLGLAIVAQTVTAMRGTLIVSSAVGAGTAFTLYVPELQESELDAVLG